MLHIELLRIAWSKGRNQSPAELLEFPYEFSSDIVDAIMKIRRRLSKLNALPRQEYDVDVLNGLGRNQRLTASLKSPGSNN
jgi:hypothetical protein